MSKNGQQKAQQEFEAFKACQATQTDDDFKKIIVLFKCTHVN